MYACFKRRNSDSAAMAARSTDLVTNQEPAEVQEECSGKKKSKFRTFRKLFARKKRKEPQITGAEEGLKGSQSSDDVSKASENNALTRSEKDKGSGSKISLGNKALSHDSVFVSESSEANEGLGASQDSIHGKVKSLQLQLKQAIRLGSPPSLMCVKKTEDAGTMSEDDGLPCSPPDYRLLHSVKSKAERSSSNSLHGIDSDEQLSCAASGGAASPPAVPGDFSQPASPFVCLDNSAAKHKLGLRNKACNGRKPARRLELKAEADSAAEEELMVSLAVADMWEEEEQQRAEVESVDHLKPKAESDGEEDEEEDRSQRDSLTFLPGDEEAEDEPETEQDVSHAPEEDPSDDQHVPCSATSSRSSSLDSPSDTTESPAGPITYLAGPPGSPCDVDDGSESGSSSEEDGSARESTEEESSLLEEVLSSLKTSHSANMEIGGAVLEETETESVTEIDEREVEEEDEAAACEAAALCANPTADEEEVGEKPEVLFHPSQQEEVPVEEEEKTTEDEVYEDEEEEEEEILVEGRIQQNDVEEAGRGEEDAAEAASEEENDDVVSSQTVNQEEAEDEQDGGEEEEEAAEVKEGPETAEEELDNREEEICVEVDDGGEAEEEMTELVRDPEDEEVLSRSSSPGAGERDDGATSDDTTPEMDDQELPTMNEGEGILGNPSGGEEEVEEGELQGSKSEDEEEQEVERSPSDADGSEDDLDWGEVQTSSVGDVEPLEAGEEGGALSKAPPMPFPESDESPVSSPSKTASLHINLTSPTSEKPVSLLALRSAADDGRDTSHVTSATNELQEAASDREEEEEDKESPQERNHPAPEAMQEVSAQPTDQSNVRFTIAPAWQRLQSPPSPPSAVPELQDDGAEARAASQKHLDLKADTGGPPKAEPVLSPSRARSSGSFTSEPRSRAPSSPAELQTAASPRTSEKASVAEANPDSPFGVRLRKTSAALVRLGSEEASSEPQAESPRHPPSSKAESPQEIGSKPALPKKPEVQLRRISGLCHPLVPLSLPCQGALTVADAVGLPCRVHPEPAAARGLSGRTDPPSWISVAKQKQKVYKETPLNEIAVKKEEQEKKPILPTSASKEPSNDKTVEPTRKVSAEKETRKTLSVPTPVPPKPLLQKPQVPPVSAKPAPRPDSNQTPRSAPLKSPGPAAPSILSKATPVTSPSVSPRTVQEKPGSRAAGFSRQAAPHQRGSPPAALPQNDPPWMALAKKKAKAWSEMPQIVQ